MIDDTLKVLKRIERHLRRLAEYQCGPEPKKAEAVSVVSVTTLPGGRVEVSEASGTELPRQLNPAEELAMQEQARTPRGLGSGGDGVTVDETILQNFTGERR